MGTAKQQNMYEKNSLEFLRDFRKTSQDGLNIGPLQCDK